MTTLAFIRTSTTALGVAYCLSYLPDDWLSNVLGGPSIIYEGYFGLRYIIAKIIVCLAALASIGLVYFAIPRYRWGVSALSWCCVLMGLAILAQWIPWDYMPIWTQLAAEGRRLAYAMPAFILAGALRQRPITSALISPATQTSNHAMERTSTRHGSTLALAFTLFLQTPRAFGARRSSCSR